MSKMLLLLALVFKLVLCHEHSHTYDTQEQVVLWTDTISPYHNRQETYPYYSVPFCKGPSLQVKHYHETVGEALQGVELQNSGLDIGFLEKNLGSQYCSRKLEEKEVKSFRYAIAKNYIFTMYIDDLPVSGRIGFIVENANQIPKFYLYTRQEFTLGFNNNQIVEANLELSEPVLVELGVDLKFSYSVNWLQSRTPFNKRFEKYLDREFFQHKVRWFSIFNSLIMILLLVALVTMILMRTLRKDIARYTRDAEFHDLEHELGDDYGWKQVHADVFRPPGQLMLFSTLVGSGAHLANAFIFLLATIVVGDLYEGRGEILQATIFVYAALSFVGGFTGAGLYARNGGQFWIRQVFLQSFFFPALVSIVILSVNLVAVYYSSSRAIPFITLAKVICIGLFGVLPLTFVGSVFGRNISSSQRYPCRVNPVPRRIPPKKWFMSPFAMAVIGGILPFLSILMEMYFIFASFWEYRVYYVYSFACLVFVILIVVTICVTIVSMYNLLNGEDYRWWWASFACAASTGVYLFLYSIYYFIYKTKMYGFFQTSFFFGYTSLLCIGVSLLTGAIGHFSADVFIRKIYSNLKVE